MVQASHISWHSKASLTLGGALFVRDDLPTHPSGPFLDVSHPAPSILEAMALAEAGQGFCFSPRTPVARPINRGHFVTKTGGTSGAPKLIERSQASWCTSFTINAELFEISHHTRVATLGTLDHSLTLYAGIEALTLGAEWVYLGDLTPLQQLNSLDVDVIYATPTQMRLLSLRSGERTLLRPKHIVLGGAKLDPTTRYTTQSLFPNAQIHEFYGAAECSFITIADKNTPPDSVGRPYPNVEMKIDENGVIHVKSPYLCAGYLSQGHDLTLIDGFISIDEVGEVDEKGYLYLKGRRSGMFTVADRNVFPEEIENALLHIEGVKMAAVLPIPDPNRGNRAVAFLVVDHTIETTEISRVGVRPKDIYILDSTEWPLLPSQKTDRTALRERFL